MRWFCFTVIGLLYSLIKQSYAPCPNIKVPTKFKIYSAAEKRQIKTIYEIMVHSWVQNNVGRKKRDISKSNVENGLDTVDTNLRVKRSFNQPKWPQPKWPPEPRWPTTPNPKWPKTPSIRWPPQPKWPKTPSPKWPQVPSPKWPPTKLPPKWSPSIKKPTPKWPRQKNPTPGPRPRPRPNKTPKPRPRPRPRTTPRPRPQPRTTPRPRPQPRTRPRPRPTQSPGGRRVRKEYRQMTEEEMEKFHTCLQRLKDSGQYDDFARMHQINVAPAAHLGTAFMPWHRWYINRVEQSLRRLDGCAGVYLPYWDCTLDQPLPDPKDAVIWTDDYWGQNNGFVTKGRLGKDWGVISECENIGVKLRRGINTTFLNVCERNNIISTFAAQSFGEMNEFTEGVEASQFEINHGAGHCTIGNCRRGQDPGCEGHMGCVDCGPGDPSFYLLHSFVDCLWYEWSDIHGKDNSYPRGNVPGGQNHSADAPMRPFLGVKNRDGMKSDSFTLCLPRPGRAGFRCHSDKECESPQGLLWCSSNQDGTEEGGGGRRGNRSKNRQTGGNGNNRQSGDNDEEPSDCACRSKVKEGGNCRGMPHRACYCKGKRGNQGKCVKNKCQC